MIARPRAYVTYRFGFDSRSACYIHCWPQQRWEAKETDNGGRYVELSHKNVSIVIPRGDFEEHWRLNGDTIRTVCGTTR